MAWNERRGDELEKLSHDFTVPLTLSGCGGRQPDVLCYSSTESSLSFPQRSLIDPSANGNPVPWPVASQAATQALSFCYHVLIVPTYEAPRIERILHLREHTSSGL